jgi:hypothetical protein
MRDVRTSHDNCPLCNGALVDAKQLRVCSACHDSLQLGGAIPVTATGEFAAMPGSQAARILANPPPPSVDLERDESASCSWCGKGQNQVKKVLSRGSTHICNECVAFCTEILSMEFGDSWK